MLKTLRENLKVLSQNPADPYPAIIKRLAGKRDAACFEEPLRRLILAMPYMIAQLQNWAEESGLPSRHRLLRGFALAYLNHPEDVMPERGVGLFGYLDDAYLIARVYHLTMQEPDWSGQRYHIDDEDLARNIPAWLGLARRLAPKETARIDDLIEDVSRGREDAISAALTKSTRPSRAVMRLARSCA